MRGMSTVYGYLTGDEAPPYTALGGRPLVRLVRAPGLRLGQVFAGCASYYAYQAYGGRAYYVRAEIRCPEARWTSTLEQLRRRFAPTDDTGALKHEHPILASVNAAGTVLVFSSADTVRFLADWLEPNLHRAPRPAATGAWVRCARLVGRGHTRSERDAAIASLRASCRAEPPARLADAANAWADKVALDTADPIR